MRPELSAEERNALIDLTFAAPDLVTQVLASKVLGKSTKTVQRMRDARAAELGSAKPTIDLDTVPHREKLMELIESARRGELDAPSYSEDDLALEIGRAVLSLDARLDAIQGLLEAILERLTPAPLPKAGSDSTTTTTE